MSEATFFFIPGRSVSMLERAGINLGCWCHSEQPQGIAPTGDFVEA